MNRKALCNEISKGLAATLVIFLILETVLRIAYFARNSMLTEVPLPYVFGSYYGPIPPWLDGLRMLESDEVLIWRNRPNIQRKYIDIFSPAQREQERMALLGFFPHLPNSLKGNPTWEVSLNSEGFRDVEFPKENPSSAFRIVCLGDSWTFGWNVAQNQAYPQTLKALLRQVFSQANFEVLNLGVGGYGSLNGLNLLKTRVLDLKPDVAVIGFAMNEPNMAGAKAGGKGLDIPYIRSFTVEDKNSEKKVYTSIQSFGKVYMQADPWHTNAAGYKMIAQALVDVLKKDSKVRDYLQKVNDGQFTRASSQRSLLDGRANINNAR